MVTIPDLLRARIPTIETILGYSFTDPTILATACIHRSYANEHLEVAGYNERLEFLGDAVLGFFVAAHLYDKYPDVPEGELSSLRSRLVDAKACSHYLQHLDLTSFLLLGRGEQQNFGRGRATIWSDFFEAIVGAIYLDGGLEATHFFFREKLLPTMDELVIHAPQNWKAVLQDWSQRHFQTTPVYSVIDESGPDHKKSFRIAVCLGERPLGQGEGESKKTAQQAAAEEAIRRLQDKGEWVK